MNYKEAVEEADKKKKENTKKGISYYVAKVSFPLQRIMERYSDGKLVRYYAGILTCPPEMIKKFPVVTDEQLLEDDWYVEEMDWTDF